MPRDEILAGPLELYLAPLESAFPEPEDPVAGLWDLLGASGDENYDSDGVTTTFGQTIEEFIPAGSTLPVKATRTEESIGVEVTLADVRAETLSIALNSNEPEAGAGLINLTLLRGFDVAEFALLARGRSPYEPDGVGQLQLPRARHDGEPSITWSKSFATVTLAFRALLPAGASVEDLRLIYTVGS